MDLGTGCVSEALVVPRGREAQARCRPLFLGDGARLAAAVIAAVDAHAMWWLCLVALGALAQAHG